MKTLMESLFDDKLIEKDLFGDTEFKNWINNPETLWYLYYYWESDMEDPFEDFMPEQWARYKPLVDELLKMWCEAMHRTFGSKGWSWWWTNYDQYENDSSVQDSFQSEGEFTDFMGDMTYEIHHKATQESDGIWKTWFKGGFPKNSNITAFIHQIGLPMGNAGKLDGAICLTNDDTVIILGFPRGINKSILKLFNIK